MQKEVIKDIIQWDVKAWSKALSYWDTEVNWDGVNTCLELGAREGGLSLWLALKGKTVICSDLKDVKGTAGKLHSRYQFISRGGQIEYRDIDATNIPYQNHFDLIIFKSVLGGIGRNGNNELQKKFVDEIYKALKPDGKVLFAENLAASPLHRFLRKKFNNWGDYWGYPSLQNMENLFNHFLYLEYKTTGFLGALGRNERQKNILTGIDEAIVNRVCPERWRYIMYGIAGK